MKEGWTYKKLGEVIDHLRTGLNPRTHFKLNTPDAECYYITVRELKGFTINPDEKTDKVNRAAIKRINERSSLKIGDVLFSGTGTIGKTALVSELPEKWNIKEGVYAMTPKHSELDSKYFIYYIGSEFFLRLVNDKAAGTGVRSIPMKELVKLPIPVPPLSEQLAIVARLDSAFAHIDSLQANAEKQLSEARKLFQKALEEAMTPKEGWEEKTIGEIADVKGGKRVPKGYKLESSDTGYKYIRVSDFTDDGTIDLTNIQYISKEVYEQIKRYTITDEDLYISIAGTIGKSGIIPPDLNGANLTENACKLVFKTNINKRFVYFFTKSDIFMSQVSKATKQASQPKLALTRLAEIVISIPPLSTQHTIVAHLDALSSHVRALEEKLRKMKDECDALKQAMLREVFE